MWNANCVHLHVYSVIMSIITSSVQGKSLPSTAAQWPWKMHSTTFQRKMPGTGGYAAVCSQQEHFSPDHSAQTSDIHGVIEIPGCLYFSSHSFSDFFGNARKWGKQIRLQPQGCFCFQKCATCTGGSDAVWDASHNFLLYFQDYWKKMNFKESV